MMDAETFGRLRLAQIAVVEAVVKEKGLALRAFVDDPTDGNAAAFRVAKAKADAEEAELRRLHEAWAAMQGGRGA